MNRLKLKNLRGTGENEIFQWNFSNHNNKSSQVKTAVEDGTYRSPGRAQQHSGEAVKQKSYLFFHDPAESICTPFIIRSSRSDQNHRFLIYLLQVPRVLCTLHPAVLNIGFT